MESSPHHIAQQLRGKLPPEKRDASWGTLAGQFPWFPLFHLMRAAENRSDTGLLQKAALYQDNLVRLNIWLEQDKYAPAEALSAPAPPETVQPLVENSPVEAGVINIPNITETVDAGPDGKPAPPAAPPPVNPDAEDTPVAAPAAGTQEIAAVETPGPDGTGETDDAGQDSPVLPMPDLGKLLDRPLPAGTGLAFEPYHTVDYFASQGIKVDKEADKQTATQLDRQVKSFTEWLKTMKKLSYQPTVTYNDPLVDTQARTSLNNKEIVTEAMAEVWEKQGNYRMAAQVYAKLMLQHPEKTPYFAARLQDLKEKQ